MPSYRTYFDVKEQVSVTMILSLASENTARKTNKDSLSLPSLNSFYNSQAKSFFFRRSTVNSPGLSTFLHVFCVSNKGSLLAGNTKGDFEGKLLQKFHQRHSKDWLAPTNAPFHHFQIWFTAISSRSREVKPQDEILSGSYPRVGGDVRLCILINEAIDKLLNALTVHSHHWHSGSWFWWDWSCTCPMIPD